MKRCVKSSHFPPSEKWALKEAKNKSTALSDGALLCLYRAAEKDISSFSRAIARLVQLKSPYYSGIEEEIYSLFVSYIVSNNY